MPITPTWKMNFRNQFALGTVHIYQFVSRFKKWSVLVIIFIGFYITSINFSKHLWTYPNKVIASDVNIYYSYLPAAFIYHDLSFAFVADDPVYFGQKMWISSNPAEHRLPRTTMGMAVLYAPFFGVAHLSVKLLGYETDGYSVPYKFWLQFGILFYLILGLLFLRKVLLKYFTEGMTSLILILIFFTTNLLYYSIYEATLPHAYLFALVSVYLYLVIKWHEKVTILLTFWIGLLAGFITLIRPSDIIVLFILFFWGVYDLRTARSKFKFFIRSYSTTLVLTLSFLLVWIPQLLYWKWITGTFFYYSYGTKHESFFFGNPQIIPNLFSYRNGWLLYSPVMLLALAGIPLFAFRLKKAFLPLLIYMIAAVYIISSWWCWWYGGSFGQRPYVDSYAILALPLGVMVSFLLKKNKILAGATTVFLIFFTFLSLFQTYQYSKGILHFDSMTKEAYWAEFLKTKKHIDFKDMLAKPDYEKALMGIYVTLPKDPYVKITDENCVEEMMKRILNSKIYTEQVREKARERGIAFEEMLRIEAGWICRKRKSSKQ